VLKPMDVETRGCDIFVERKCGNFVRIVQPNWNW